MPTIPIVCDHCGKTTQRERSDIAHRKRQGQTRFYCSKKCLGHNNPRKARVKRYRMITFPDGTQIYEHRYNMEKKLGRKLLSNEQVHHLDEDKSNNSLENLILVDARKHSLAHAQHNWDFPQAVTLYKEGVSISDIARRLNHPRMQDVWRALVNHGIHQKTSKT